MVRSFYGLILCAILGADLLSAKIVAGVAITVNGDPITLHDISQTQKDRKMSKKEAIDFLVSQKIRDQELVRLKIDVSDARIDSEIHDMAYRNGLSSAAFLDKVRQQEGLSPSAYKKQLKEQIKTQELMRSILASNVTGEDEMRSYYNQHQDEFSMPKEILAMRFTSHNKASLEQAMRNPNTAIKGVERAEENIPIDSLPPPIAQVFAATKVGQFTQILNGGNGALMTFLIKEKKDSEKISYQQAKNFIAQKLIEKRQNKILEDYFEKVKKKAVIINLRN